MQKRQALPKELLEFYNSSPMREGVLCWYPFKNEAVTLDFSGGALTEILRKRDAQVSAPCDSSNDAFDYVVVLDPDDFSVEALRNLRERLNLHGRLLLAYENPFALRYWSGKRSTVTGLPYDSLIGRGNGVSKAELSIRLKLAGFEGQKWYYPLTDHWFTREVYSDNYLPDEYMNQRFVPYIADDITLQFDERGLYREVIRGGAFEFMCGAYLVEARVSEKDEPCEVDYAAVTAYREPAKRFATIVFNNGYVHKTPLHDDGHESIQKILRNHEELAQLGISVVPLQLKGQTIVMPKLDYPTLWDYWAKKLSNGSFDEKEMINHFDSIHDTIYRAAKTGKCFWELVPANCFYNAERDEMIFFDQEYSWDNVSPDVAVARAILAIRYSPILRADPRAENWLEYLKKRYSLNTHWDELLQLASKETNLEVFGDGTAELIEMTAIATDRISTLRRYRSFCPIASKLNNLNLERPAIYGYGKRGKALSDALIDNEVEIAAVYDQKLAIDKPIEEAIAETTADAIIVSILNAEDIAEDLRSRVSIPVYTPEELLDEQP